jgi:hypothetical protein
MRTLISLFTAGNDRVRTPARFYTVTMRMA